LTADCVQVNLELTLTVDHCTCELTQINHYQRQKQTIPFRPADLQLRSLKESLVRLYTYLQTPARISIHSACQNQTS
jgi:hypothetical protein